MVMRLVRYHMKLKYLLPLAIGALLIAGCAASRDQSAESPAGQPGQGPALTAPEADKGAGTDALGVQPTDAPAATAAPLDPRSLIYRADLTVRVEDVEKAADDVTTMVTTAGGFIASEKRTALSDSARATIVVRVPSKEYPALLDRIGGLGREEVRSSNVEDVTEAIVDLDTRIAAQQASVESVRRMFEQATSLEDVVLLEKELSQRQAELASLEAKKRRLADLVALSTITVTLAGPNTEIEVEDERDPTFLGGLKAGWRAFIDTFEVGSAVIGFLLPFLIAVAIPIVLIILFLRYRRRQLPPPPTPPSA